MKVSKAGRQMIEGFEGLRLHAYQDVVGVWTIGYGHTEGVQPSDEITREEAGQILAEDLDAVYGPGVEAALESHPATQNQFDAMVSLAYNIGVGGFRRSSVVRNHRAGNYQAAAEAFLLWNKAGGRVLKALARRRQAEAELYLSQPAAPAEPPPDTVTIISSFDRIRAIQVILNVKPDGDFGDNSRAALNKQLRAAGQMEI